jgi:hypothetical protein
MARLANFTGSAKGSLLLGCLDVDVDIRVGGSCDLRFLLYFSLHRLVGI